MLVRPVMKRLVCLMENQGNKSSLRSRASLLYDTSTRCTYSSLEPLVPDAAYTWYLVRYMQAPNRLYKSEVRGSVSRVKTPCEQGLPHYTYVLQTEQRLPHATEEKAKRSFPMERGPTAKHHPAWNPQCTQRFRAEEFPLLCPKPKVMPRFSLGDVAEVFRLGQMLGAL